MNVNKAFILGNVTKDPELRMLPSGQQVASFSIATNRYYTTQQGEKKEEAEFHNIVCFGKLADISSRYLKKGGLVFIEGRIKTRNWVNQQGQKQYRTEVIAETMQLGPKNGGPSVGGGSSNYQKQSPSAQDEEPLGHSQTGEAKQDDIPVIEENYGPPSHSVSLDNNQGEIDVKDIPF